MDQQNYIEKLLPDAVERAQGDISRLLGVDFIMAEGKCEIVAGGMAFDLPVKRMLCVRMDIVGSSRSQAFLLIGIRDAIRLGGTLILLPGRELKEIISHEEFNAEIEDSFGEIVNIITESFSVHSVEKGIFPCQFTRREQDLVIPSQAYIGDDEIQGKTYIRANLRMSLDGKRIGSLVLLFPTDAFDGIDEETASTQLTMEPLQQDREGSVTEPAVIPHVDRKSGVVAGGPRQDSEDQPVADDAGVKKSIDRLLAACSEKALKEISTLFGKSIATHEIVNKFSCIDHFVSDEISEKQVVARLIVQGQVEETAFLLMKLRTAIRIGGELIMTPEMILESMIDAGEFAGDTADAFSEVINIVSEAYTETFAAEGAKNIRITKIGLQELDPHLMTTASMAPWQDREYYQSSMTFTLGDDHTDTMHLLLPSVLFDPENENVDKSFFEEEALQHSDRFDEIKSGNSCEVSKCAESDTGSHGNVAEQLDILLIHDEEKEMEKIREVLEGLGYSTLDLSFKDNLHSYLSGELKAIYLVMKNVNEQTFGAAIKISSACSVPLIAAGPGWTRSKVIKAVKYGVSDILLTPASSGDIEKNAVNNLLKYAA
ncbi:MAG: hypothetical protein ACWGOX_05235 [Desulforhopalus sp.]